jgi:hypothetical protein
MRSGLQADLDRIRSHRFAAVADVARVTRTAAALQANGFGVLRATSAEEANGSSWVSSRPDLRSITAPRSRSRCRALPTRGPVGTSLSARES